MCGRFTLTRKAKELEEDFSGFPVDPRMEPRYNISPTQPVSAWVADPGLRLEILNWGLIPPWAKDPSFGAKCINARAETLSEKPSFKTSFLRKRCLIPADGWYEWVRKSGGRKLPVRFRRRDERGFGFAGLWEEWHDGEGGMILSCAVITVRANLLARKVHPRMPALLREEDWQGWLDPRCSRKELERMLEPVAGDDFLFYPVSPAVNRAGFESPDLTAPWQEAPAPTQGELF